MTQRAKLWADTHRRRHCKRTDAGRGVNAVPWYIRAMVGLAAWMAALFLFLFLGHWSFRNAATTRSGAMVVGAGIAVRRLCCCDFSRATCSPSNLRSPQAWPARHLVAFGLLGHDWNAAGPWLAVAAFEVVLVALAPDYLHRVLSTLAAALATRMVLAAIGSGDAFSPAARGRICRRQGNEHRLPARDAIWAPVTTGLALAPLLVVPLRASMWDEVWDGRSAAPFVSPSVVAGHGGAGGRVRRRAGQAVAGGARGVDVIHGSVGAPGRSRRRIAARGRYPESSWR